MSFSWCEVEEFSENVIYYPYQSDRKKDYFGDIVALLFQLPIGMWKKVSTLKCFEIA